MEVNGNDLIIRAASTEGKGKDKINDGSIKSIYTRRNIYTIKWRN